MATHYGWDDTDIDSTIQSVPIQELVFITYLWNKCLDIHASDIHAGIDTGIPSNASRIAEVHPTRWSRPGVRSRVAAGRNGARRRI